MTVRNRCASYREPISLLWASWNSGTKIPSTVSSPYRSLAARNGSALAPFEKKETKPSQMEQDFLDLVSTRFKRMEMADID